MSEPKSISGEAAGVPFIASPPTSDRASVATLFIWHMHDPPRSEMAMAAALPLRGVDAWRVYLGLPLSGKRLPGGGLEAFYSLGYEDAVLKLYAPTVRQAVEEFPSALTELRRRLGVAQGGTAFVGASIGSCVAMSILAAGEPAVTALALVSPALRLAGVVGANERRFQVSYRWSKQARAVAAELDFVARASEIARHGAPTCLIVGADDDEDGIINPAEQLRDALDSHGIDASLHLIPGMAHVLADEPGLEAMPQTPTAATVDALLTRWLNDHVA